MPQCDIYVINILDSIERRAHIEAQLQAIGLPYRIFSAVDGKKDSHPLFDKYNETKRVKLKGKAMVGGQLGCYASHYLLWERCVVEQRSIIILEDDARLFKEKFMDFYNSINKLSSRYECIRLFESYGKKRRAIGVENIGNMQIAKYTKGYMGTIGYYLTPAGAKKLIQGSAEWFLTVDIYMDRFWANKVEYYGLVPACLDFDPKFVSEIDYVQDRGARSVRTIIQRELFSVSEAVRRMVWNLCFRAKYFGHLLIIRKGRI